jgi:hypothetical protein
MPGWAQQTSQHDLQALASMSLPQLQLLCSWHYVVLAHASSPGVPCLGYCRSNAAAKNSKAAKNVKKKVAKPAAANWQPLYMPHFPPYHASEDPGYPQQQQPSSPGPEAWRGPAGAGRASVAVVHLCAWNSPSAPAHAACACWSFTSCPRGHCMNDLCTAPRLSSRCAQAALLVYLRTARTVLRDHAPAAQCSSHRTLARSNTQF